MQETIALDATDEAAQAAFEQTEPSDERQNYPGDCGTLPMEVRKVLVTLLKGPYLYKDRRADAWTILTANREVICEQLANLLLDLVVDEAVGVAYVRRPDLGDITAPSLLNTYTFGFLDSVLLVEMRDRLMRAQQNGERAIMGLDEIRTHLAVFEPSSKTDTDLFSRRVTAVLKRMKEKHLLLELGRSSSDFEVSPVLKVVFAASQVDALRQRYADHIAQIELAESVLTSEE